MTTRFTFGLAAIAAAGLTFGATATNAATTFLTNNTSPKSLASNEGDAAALEGATPGTATPLTLSSDDGGGSITLTSTEISAAGELGMDADSMGNGNDKWGNDQRWTFEFDKPVSFDALTMITIDEDMILQSTAWGTDSDATGSKWSFTSDGTTGTFSIFGSNSGPGTYDFTSAGVSTVAAGTEMTFGFPGGATGGEELSSFTISVIPEPASLSLMGLGGLMLLPRRKRKA
jgi:hypothetical protein